MNRTKTYTAKVSKPTHKNLDDFLHQQRKLYNFALQERRERYARKGKNISKYDQVNDMKQIRANDEWFARYDALAQRSCLFTLHKAFDNFFRRVKNGEKPGYPRFKGRGRGIRSFEKEQPTLNKQGKWTVFNPKGIGKFRFKCDHGFVKRFDAKQKPKEWLEMVSSDGEVIGRVKKVRVVKTPLRVKVQLVCEMPETKPMDGRAPLGIDVGVKSQMTLSNGHQVEKRVLDRRRKKRLQRKISKADKFHDRMKSSKAEKYSNSRKKRVARLAKEWRRITEREKGSLHEMTTRLVKEQSARLIFEDINIRNITASGGNRKKPLNRSILEQNWGQTIQMLAYKAESAGGYVEKVDPKNTTQTCSACNRKADIKVVLGVDVFKCKHCGHIEDRDLNAARNIEYLGLAKKAGIDFEMGSGRPFQKPRSLSSGGENKIPETQGEGRLGGSPKVSRHCVEQ